MSKKNENLLEYFINKFFINNEKFNYIFYFLIFVSILLLSLVIMRSKTARAIIYVSIFIFINVVVSIYKRFIKLPIEIEFMTFGIVLITYNFGIKAGLIFAILGGILSFIVSFNISPFSFPMLMGYMLMALITLFFQYFNITESLFLIGIIASFINNLFVFLFYHIVFDYDMIKNISYSVSNFLFNFLVFYYLLDLVKVFIIS